MKEIIQKLRKYEIRIRKAVEGRMEGTFNSVFKGAGLEFDDVRAYQYGDDIRHIDWNVSAKGHGTFVKTFREEKEQTVFFMLDVSASQETGSRGRQKADVAKEICGVLALSAIKEGSQVGLYTFSDKKEKYLPPGRGLKQAYVVIRTLFTAKPDSPRTSLSNAIYFSLNILKKRSVIILISDFLDDNYQHTLSALARQHDLVVLHVYNEREINFPKVGIIPVVDKEKGVTTWVNTSLPGFGRRLGNTFHERRNELALLCKRQQVNMLSINTEEDFVPSLVKLFKTRNRSRKTSL